MSNHKHCQRLALVHGLSGVMKTTSEYQDVATKASAIMDHVGVGSIFALSGVPKIDMPAHSASQQQQPQLDLQPAFRP